MDQLPLNEFAPARSKLEAVKRIGRLTDTFQELGPGSKERKNALVAISDTLGLRIDSALNKPEFGSELARALGARWGPECFSAGHTITLVGLNVLLEQLESRSVRIPKPGVAASAEARSILETASQVAQGRWDGRAAVEEMRVNGSTQWAQDEWAGFYFEFLTIPALVENLGGGPVRLHNTRFDYQFGHVWDLKWHGAKGGAAPLNDGRAIEQCADAGGVGFVVMSGEVEYDGGDFREWQRSYRLRNGRRKPAERDRPLAYVRKSKFAFTPSLLEAFFIPDRSALKSAVQARAMRPMAQGRQTSGAARSPKYSLDLTRARDSLRIAHLDL